MDIWEMIAYLENYCETKNEYRTYKNILKQTIDLASLVNDLIDEEFVDPDKVQAILDIKDNVIKEIQESSNND